MRALCSFLTLTLLFVTAISAQISVPRVVRYAATLPETAQQSGAIGVTFSIYRDQYDGAPLWSEVQNVTSDKHANYSVMLGSTRNEGLPMEVFASNEPRWLEIEINGKKESRVLIGSVPYAMVAADAQTLGGLPPSAYMRTDLATTTTTSVISAPTKLKPAFTSNGTPGYLSLFTDGAGDLGNSALFQNGNTISIGGTSSLGALTLIGNVASGDTAGMALYNAGGGGGSSVSLDMYNTYANGGIPQAKIKALDDGAFSDHITFWTKNQGAATNPVAERVRITSTGNVGIGTTSPGAKLEVAGYLKVSGVGNGLIFPDGSVQRTAVTSFGTGNTATGALALPSNSTGTDNTANGASALGLNINGSYNTAIGGGALGDSGTGSYNTALGSGALGSNVFGSYNIGVGVSSGGFVTSGSYNIEIGNVGGVGTGDDHVIRIGDVQTQTYIAGISGVNVSGVPVVVSSTGQLGVVQSSRRYKEDIQDIGEASTGLMRLRPVTYHYKQPYADGSKPLDYGLIAEEVAEVYPDLVAHSQDGQIQTVMYQKLTPLLLNELQRVEAQNAAQAQQIRALEDRLQRLESLLNRTGAKP